MKIIVNASPDRALAALKRLTEVAADIITDIAKEELLSPHDVAQMIFDMCFKNGAEIYAIRKDDEVAHLPHELSGRMDELKADEVVALSDYPNGLCFVTPSGDTVQTSPDGAPRLYVYAPTRVQ